MGLEDLIGGLLSIPVDVRVGLTELARHYLRHLRALLP